MRALPEARTRNFPILSRNPLPVGIERRVLCAFAAVPIYSDSLLNFDCARSRLLSRKAFRSAGTVASVEDVTTI
jgi:hypothetical protein